MAIQEWEAAQEEFFDHWAAKGKKAFCYRFTDTKQVQAGKVSKAFTEARPADFLVTYAGETFYAEVKFTEKTDKFQLSAIRPAQWAAALKTIRAGGQYRFYIKNGLGVWYYLDASLIFEHAETSKTLHFKDYKDYIWNQMI